MSANTIKTRPFDMANYLGSEEDVAEYLGQVLAEGDPAELAAALGDIARARGMTQLARDTGLSRESLYKSLSGERAPSTDTLFKVMKALGFELKVQLAKDTAGQQRKRESRQRIEERHAGDGAAEGLGAR